jgi:hypothetical protein
MRRHVLRLACLLLWAVATPFVTGQEPARSENSVLVLREGTEVQLQFAQKVTPRTAREGEPVELVLATDVAIGNTVVAPSGSRAIGVIVRDGGFHVRATWLQAQNVKVPLRGSMRIPEMGEETIQTRQAVIHPEVTGKVYVDKDTEIAVPETQLLTGSGDEKSANATAGSPKMLRLPNGKLIRLLLTEPISSKMVKAGDTVRFQVLGDVKVDNLVVIGNKAPASATITAAHPAGMAWRSGALELRMDTVALVDHQWVPLQAQNQAKGTKTDAAYAWTNAVVQSQGLAILFLPFAPLQHGHQAILPRGTVFAAETKAEALLDRATVEASQPGLAERKHGDAWVTIYYPRLGSSPSFHVWCGLVQVGQMRKGHKLTVHLPPGKYVFRLDERGMRVPLEAEDGREAYLKVDATPSGYPPGNWSHVLSLVEHDVGEIESVDFVPAAAKDAPDVSKLDLAQLQAEPPLKKHR